MTRAGATRALALALVLLPAAAAAAPPRPRPAAPRLCVVAVSAEQRPVAAGLNAALTRAVAASSDVRTPPARQCAAVTRALRFERAGVPEAERLREVGRRRRIDLVLTARVARQARGHRVTLGVYDAARGHELARSHRDVARARVPAEIVEQMLVDVLVAALAKRQAEQVAAPPPEPPEPASAPAPASVPADEAEWAAAAAPAPAEPAVAAGEAPLDVNARMAAEHYSYFRNPAGVVGGRDHVELELTLKGHTKHVKAVGVLLARRDFVDSERDRIDAAEVALETTLMRRLTIRAGRLIAAWGATTLVNPADLLNPVDARDPLATEKLGVWMARATLDLGKVSVEACVLPVPEASRIPWPTGVDAAGQLVSRSRWALTFPAVAPGPSGPLALTYRLGDNAPPRAIPSRTQAAARVVISILGADVALGYAYLFDRLPTLITTTTPTAPDQAEVLVEALYQRLHVGVLEVERAFGRLRLAAEAVAVVPERRSASDPARLDPYLSWVAGADYQTPAFLHDHSVHFFLEFAEVRALKGALDPGPGGLLRYPLKRALAGRVAYRTGRRLTVEANLATAVAEYNLMFNPRIELTLYDKLKLAVELALLRGGADTLFGHYRDNSRVGASLEARF